jgi:hypothetical protein
MKEKTQNIDIKEPLEILSSNNYCGYSKVYVL